MNLGALAAAAGVTLPDGSGDLAGAQVTGFAIDHRKVAPGTVFGAFVGARFNGEDFIADAVKAGAVAVVARPEAKVEGAVHFHDPAPRRAFARLAAPSFAYFSSVVNQPAGKDFLSLAGPGFRDFTRIAASSPEMWRDVLVANREEVLKQSERFRRALDALEHVIREGNVDALEGLIRSPAEGRASWQMGGPRSNGNTKT
jgi:hypothetical protein